MTAEVVVMNREAVALAADSAITVGGQKVFNTANKVFMVAPDLPVGILVYNNANFMHVPWEIIISAYRAKIIQENQSFSSLQEYAGSFIKFLETSNKTYATKRQQSAIFTSIINGLLDNISKEIWKQISEEFYENAEIDEESVENIVDNIIVSAHNDWSNKDDLFTTGKNNKFKKALIKDFESIIDENINRLFDKLPISKKRRNLLLNICIYRFTKKKRFYDYSGIVIVGYGYEDLFPVCVEYHVEGFFSGIIIYEKNTEVKIGFGEEDARSAVIPFAQADVVENILTGRHPIFKNELQNQLKEKMPEEEVHEVLKRTDESVWKKITMPIVNAIDSLPKDEIAVVARTLVNLTSFMRRVSMDIETVGGPIDVALISKKDGFVWVERKHYFDIRKNLHFSYKDRRWQDGYPKISTEERS